MEVNKLEVERLQEEIKRCEGLEIADGFDAVILRMNIDVARIAIDSGDMLKMVDAHVKLQKYTDDH